MNPSLPDNSKIFNIRLESAAYMQSIFSKKIIKEFPSRPLIFGFIKSNCGISYQGITRYSHLPYQTERDQVVDYRNIYNPNYGCFVSAHILPKHGWGRVHAVKSLSLACLHRPTRHAFSRENYVDIDMRCAQVVIMCEILKDYEDLPIHNISLYADDYKNWRLKIMEHHACSKDVAKTLPIIILFGGSYNMWMLENNITTGSKMDLFQNIETEMKVIMQRVFNENKNTILKNCLPHKKRNKEWNTTDESMRGVMGLWCQSVERLMQETAIKWLTENKNIPLDTVIPCQDGFMILKEYYYEGILDDIYQANISEHNIKIIWDVKPFDEAIEIEPWTPSRTVEEWKDVMNEKKLADTFIQLYNDNVKFQDSILYVFSGSRWYSDDRASGKLDIIISEQLHNYMRLELDNDISLKKEDYERLKDRLRGMTCKATNMNAIIRHIKPKVEILENRFDNNPLVLGFENGLVELPTTTFRPYKFNDYISLTTGYDYVEYNPYNPEDVELQNQLIGILKQIFPSDSERECIMRVLASGLDGISYPRFYVCHGAGGNGKSLLLGLLQIILGTNFYFQAPTTLMNDLQKSNCASPDLYKCRNKRFINFSEVKGKWDTAVTNRLTGGGEFDARKLHQNYGTSFKMEATFTCENNHELEFVNRPTDAEYRRLVFTKWRGKFVDASKYPDKIGKVINGIHWFAGNPLYENQKWRLSMRHVFLAFMLGMYKDAYSPEKEMLVFSIPASFAKQTEEWLDEQNKFKDLFDSQFIPVQYTEEDIDTINKKKLKSVQFKDILQKIHYSEHYRNMSERQKAIYGRDPLYAWLLETFDYQCWKDPQKRKYLLGYKINPDTHLNINVGDCSDAETEPM